MSDLDQRLKSQQASLIDRRVAGGGRRWEDLDSCSCVVKERLGLPARKGVGGLRSQPVYLGEAF